MNVNPGRAAPMVLIAYHFPPDPAVGAQRASNLARAVEEAGGETAVITAVLPGEAAGLREQRSGLTVYAVRPWLSPRDLVRRLRTRPTPVPDAGPTPDPPPAPRETQPSEVSRWKRYLYSVLWVPDDRQGFIIPAVRAALRLLPRSGRGILYTTAPPFSPLLAGRLITLLRRVTWVLELRDPWCDNPQKPAFIRSRFMDRMDRWLEASCFRRADHIVCVSEGIARLVRAQLPPAQHAKVIVALNGIPALQPPRARTDRPFRVVHAGTCSYGRDPRPFLAAAARVIQSRRLGPEQFHIDFVGECSSFQNEDLRPLVARLGIERHIRFQGWLPRSAALGLMDQASLLLLLAQGQPDQIPNKLYEYLGSRIPILAFAEASGETGGILTRLGGHHLVGDNSVDQAAQALLAALDAPAGATDGQRTDALAALTTTAQLSRLLRQVGAAPMVRNPSG